MLFLLAELRRMVSDSFAIARSPARLNSLLQSPLYASSIYFLVATAINLFFGFIFWIVAARLYSADDVGQASAVVSAASLMAGLAGLGLGYGLLRFLPDSRRPAKLVNGAFTLTGLVGLAAAAVFILGLALWSPALLFLRQSGPYLLLFFLLVVAQALGSLIDQACMAARRARLILIKSLLFNVLRIGLPVALAAFLAFGGIFGSLGLAWAVAVLFGLFWVLPRAFEGYKPRPSIEKKTIGQIVPFAFANYAGDLLWAAPGTILPVLVINRVGPESNAYFFMGWSMSAVLAMVPTVVATALLAESAREPRKIRQHTVSSLRMVALLLTPLAVFVWFLAGKLLLAYGGAYAENAASLLRWLAIAALPLALNAVYFAVKRAQKDVLPVILVSAVTAVIALVLSYLLLGKLGIKGVGIAWLVAQSTGFIIALILDVRRWIKPRSGSIGFPKVRGKENSPT